jgi:hypothetical protein
MTTNGENQSVQNVELVARKDEELEVFIKVAGN